MSQILFLKNKYHFYNFSSSLFWSSFNGSTTPRRKRKGLWGPAYLLILLIFVSCCFLPKTLIFFPLHPSHLSPPPPLCLPLPPLDQQILPLSLKRTMALRPPYFCSGWTISFLFPLRKSSYPSQPSLSPKALIKLSLFFQPTYRDSQSRTECWKDLALRAAPLYSSGNWDCSCHFSLPSSWHFIISCLCLYCSLSSLLERQEDKGIYLVSSIATSTSHSEEFKSL